eukprot:jgi/Botrbrau1/7316/Bobra.247_3s0011.1
MSSEEAGQNAWDGPIGPPGLVKEEAISDGDERERRDNFVDMSSAEGSSGRGGVSGAPWGSRPSRPTHMNLHQYANGPDARVIDHAIDARLPFRRPSDRSRLPDGRSASSEARSGRPHSFTFTPEVLEKAHEAVAKALAPVPEQVADDWKSNDAMARKGHLGRNVSAPPGSAPTTANGSRPTDVQANQQLTGDYDSQPSQPSQRDQAPYVTDEVLRLFNIPRMANAWQLYYMFPGFTLESKGIYRYKWPTGTDMIVGLRLCYFRKQG